MLQAGLFGLSDHLKRLSAYGDPLEELGRIIDFEVFRTLLVAALAYGDGAKGGRPPYDPVAMLKVLLLAAQNNVGDCHRQFRARDQGTARAFAVCQHSAASQRARSGMRHCRHRPVLGRMALRANAAYDGVRVKNMRAIT